MVSDVDNVNVRAEVEGLDGAEASVDVEVLDGTDEPAEATVSPEQLPASAAEATVSPEQLPASAAEATVSPEQLPAALEALLFAAGDPLSLELMSDCTGYPTAAVETVLRKMQEDYAKSSARGLWLREVKGSFVLSTKAELRELLSGLFKPRQLAPLTPAAYEVLAVVAYNQPVTRAQVEAVRGVNSDSLMTRLEERGLIANVGTLDAPGRPGLYETTQQFLLDMNLSSAQELPPMDMLMYSSLQALEQKLERAKQSVDQVAELD